MNSYELSRAFFDWSFENPSKVNPSMGILYFFCVEHCNRLGWKPEFGLPTQMAMEAIGIRSYNTYIKTLNELVEYGFIIMVEKSKNQYSSNIVALSNFDKALDKAPNKALDKAMIKHLTKHSESTYQSNDSINKHITNNIEPINHSLPPTAPKQLEDFRNFNPDNYDPQLVEKFERFNTWVDTELPQIRKVKEQLTIDQFKLLLENFTPATIKDKVEHFGNTEKYWKGKDRRVSVFKTIKSWLKNQ